MDKNKKKLIMLAIILIVLAVTSIRAIMKITNVRSKQRAVKTKFAPVLTPQGERISLTDSTGTMESSWGQDPFTGKSIRGDFGKSSSFQLTGIIYNRNRPRESYAIIDNLVIKAGDVVGGSDMRVLEIGENEVILTDGSKRLKLTLW